MSAMGPKEPSYLQYIESGLEVGPSSALGPDYFATP